ncbi:MAG TPA: helix-turn-helix domain-containing protein [Prolixibacteraceae bacterium]|jgi:excisionase family DNA binding protein|nr:helix-turn-helix domain-containing protein [Prolixibacteraceae bacterium]HPL46201.1 helix-turn-helix domain-containing protein [Prolixibacteraceae bacterium]HQJ86876.1 helix-turn-helix domain-containing protein [Prolixibacteraceae bacterium]
MEVKNSTVYTTKEAASRLGYSLENIYRLTIKGDLKPFKMFGRSMFSDDELTRFEQIRELKRNKTTIHE